MTDNEKLLAALKELRDLACVGKVPFRKYGICGNLAVLLDFNNAFAWARDFVECAAETWALSATDLIHPVEGSKKAYITNNQKWSGKSLNRRLSLINHCINQLEGNV